MLRLPVPPLRYYKVSGPDRVEWLQGQLTQDISSLSSGDWKRTAALTATGQMSADGAVWVFDDQVILGLDRHADGAADALASRIVMEDVAFDAVDKPVVALVGAKVDGELALPIDHVGIPGFDIIAPSVDPGTEQIDYETARVEAAVPLAGIDYDSKTLAMELGPHFIQTRIAFGKGCYTGQEIVERIRSRGRTNRQWVGLRSDGPIGDIESVRITSRATSSKFGFIALAFVPVALSEVGTKLDGAEVVEIPFK